jgi:hypothetical protein
MYRRSQSYSKKLITDIRSLLWVVTVGGILLAFYCVHNNYTSSLPWITSMVGLPWASHATICSFYMVKSKAENTAADGNGIVYAAAQNEFMQEYEKNKEKYCAEVQYECNCATQEEEKKEEIDVNNLPI